MCCATWEYMRFTNSFPSNFNVNIYCAFFLRTKALALALRIKIKGLTKKIINQIIEEREREIGLTSVLKHEICNTIQHH